MPNVFNAGNVVKQLIWTRVSGKGEYLSGPTAELAVLIGAFIHYRQFSRRYELVDNLRRAEDTLRTVMGYLGEEGIQTATDFDFNEVSKQVLEVSMATYDSYARTRPTNTLGWGE